MSYTTVATADLKSTPNGVNPVSDFGEFMSRAKRRFKASADGWQDIRAEAALDFNFRAGDQWEPNIVNDRTTDGRPCLTINRLVQFLKQVTNEMRQNRPQIQINPRSGGNDDTADIIEGMVRFIQVDSDADAAYDTAADHQTAAGFGWIRVVTEYEQDSVDNQKIKIQRVKDPMKVYPDPDCVELDFSDARYFFVCEDVPRDEYVELYPNSQLASLSSFTSTGDQQWYPNGNIRVAEYFWVDNKKRTLVKWADGTTHWEDESPPEQVASAIAKRPTHQRIIRWVKMNAVEILEGWEDGEAQVVPGDWIPIVPVLGDEIIANGRKQYAGMIRFARDAQRQYNYMRTAVVETIALAPKAPYVVAEGQIEDYETIWRTLNTRNTAVLPYKPRTVDGTIVPAPQRNHAEPPIEAMSRAVSLADNDLKATMGIYDASLGAPGPEQSGRAILARQKEGDTANFNYMDNLGRALRHVGRIILSMIPVIYDVPRVVEIMDEDGSKDSVPVNQSYKKNPDGTYSILTPEQRASNALSTLHDVTRASYAVTVSVGPSYQTKRFEAVASIMQLVQAFPPVMQVAGDLLVGSMDWPGASKIAERLKMLLPPTIQDKDGMGEVTPEKFQQAMTQNQILQQQIQQLTKILESKQPEIELKRYVAQLNAVTQLELGKMKFGSDAADRDLQTLETQTGLIHDMAMAAGNAAHEENLQQLDQQHDAGQADKDRQAQADLAQQAAAQPQAA